jgi:hypothetical protein
MDEAAFMPEAGEAYDHAGRRVRRSRWCRRRGRGGYAEYLKMHEPALREAFKKNDLVAARAVVNGRNKDTYLPNGLGTFLRSYKNVGRQSEVDKELATQPGLTVADALRIWTKGDSKADQDAYVNSLQRVLGNDLNMKLSDLTSKQRQLLQKAQSDHIQRLVGNDLIGMRRDALNLKAARAKAKAEEQAKKAAAKAGQSKGRTQPAKPQTRPSGQK